ncbi:biogenesis of lysosome-related organelles complex 1 subunit 3 [Leptopilina heterotoma]|uniref:biogenesis of lysosome-related organelles complex 1 subunit 3 n=1 Tax=Leptopilina heterotoma TaxID=63436 RepID=UPI001CA8C5CD|nr:biogenesis of lysosome-related organelles complex 1 subunit 3 [Leptopilina heterotoma]XP_043466145.1 biogenesis of lysosome-related organelles complex 1 subunit 3 [Leptopilina heterotoma]
MDSKAVVISGEASESDDEVGHITTGIGFPTLNTCGTIITGEAQESDDDEASLSSLSSAIDAAVCPSYTEAKVPKQKKSYIKYNSLLHFKLYECNIALDNDVQRTVQNLITTGIQELSIANRQLLKSELILQEAACQLRNASNRTANASNSLLQLLDLNFLHTIKS